MLETLKGPVLGALFRVQPAVTAQDLGQSAWGGDILKRTEQVADLAGSPGGVFVAEG